MINCYLRLNQNKGKTIGFQTDSYCGPAVQNRTAIDKTQQTREQNNHKRRNKNKQNNNSNKTNQKKKNNSSPGSMSELDAALHYKISFKLMILLQKQIKESCLESFVSIFYQIRG